MANKINNGTYDNPDKYTIKIIGRIKIVKTWCTEMHYTDNPSYGRFQFAIPDNKIKNFLQGYKLRK